MSEDLMTQALAYVESAKIENVLKAVVVDVDAAIVSGPERLRRFHDAFNQRFPPESEIRLRAEICAWLMLEPALAMIYSGQTSAVYVELYGLLELYALRDLAGMLARDTKSACIVKDLLKRKVLPELAESIKDVGFWNAEDLQFARSLSDIRNGIAHRNPRLLSNRLGSGTTLHHFDAMILASEADCIPFVIRTIELLVKLSFYGSSREDTCGTDDAVDVT